MIEVTDLSKSFRSGGHRMEILKGINLKISKGEVVAIEGPSGSGKSTLLGLLAGFDSPTHGSIRIDGEEITALDEDQLALLRGKKLGFVFQSYNLIPTLTAEENVMLPLELLRHGDAQERARELLSAVRSRPASWALSGAVIRRRTAAGGNCPGFRMQSVHPAGR